MTSAFFNLIIIKDIKLADSSSRHHRHHTCHEHPRQPPPRKGLISRFPIVVPSPFAPGCNPICSSLLLGTCKPIRIPCSKLAFSANIAVGNQGGGCWLEMHIPAGHRHIETVDRYQHGPRDHDVAGRSTHFWKKAGNMIDS